MNKKVLVAMSGGVDSTIAAFLLKQAGYDVVGATMLLWKSPRLNNIESDKDCCSPEGVNQAKKSASILNIPHYEFCLKEEFYKKVVKNFITEYQRGKTPNPCILCNQYIKFEALLKKAHSLDINFIATGHYSKIIYDKKTKRYKLYKGKDSKKDQSYFLYCIKQGQLAHTLFPLGDYTKKEVRDLARRLGLSVADRSESQEICFVPEQDTKKFLKVEASKNIKSGPIYDTKGKLLGQHKGIIFYTVGQRRGIGLAASEPFYVIKINPENNSIIVGKRKELYSKEFSVEKINWISFSGIDKFLKAKVRIRYNTKEAEATIKPLDKKRARIIFSKPQFAITPGQSAVFYRGDEVLGGGVIMSRGVRPLGT